MSRASERLSLTQPTLSRMVKTIEAAVGAPVLRRGRYGVTPTAIGERLAQEGREIARRARLADEAIDHWKLGLTGEVRVGVGPMLAATVMGSFFAQAVSRNWPYSLQVVSEYAARAIDALNNDRLDAAILPSHLNLHQERLSQTPLFDDQLCIFASATGRFANWTKAIRPRDLAGMPWVETAAVSGLMQPTREIFEQTGLTQQPPKLRFSGDILMALQVVAEADALCILPRRALSQLAVRAPIKPLELSVPLPRRDIAFWTTKAKRDRPEILHLQGKLETYIAEVPLGP